ncbi:PHB depolymerase family esterase [Gimesia sp.]|uniref:carboxylesterase family protein n=1 Tax=Gimesia sp. TaxID=2024833 RepID=UPI0032ED5A4C
MDETLNNLPHVDEKIKNKFVEDQISREFQNGILTIPYRIMSPENLSTGRKYPLVVFLHGAGSRGSDNYQQLQTLPKQLATPLWRKKYESYVMAPQCPSEFWWGMWQVTDQVAILIQETIQSHPQIDPDRVYLIGLSMGGSGCWSLATRHPDLFAAIASFCGQGNPENASTMSAIPIWVVHGDDDRVINVSYSREMVHALQKVNAKVVYHELPGIGHNCWEESYQEPSPMMNWMFQQNRYKRR